MSFVLFSIANVFLEGSGGQSPASWQDWAAIIGIPVAIAAIMIPYILEIRKDRNAKFLGFLKEVDDEIWSHLKEEKDLAKLEHCLTYAYRYLEILDRISYLLQRDKIPPEFSDYYQNHFNYAHTMMTWYLHVYDDGHSPEENWPSLIEWFNNHKIKPYDFGHLPEIMQEELKLDPAKISKITQM